MKKEITEYERAENTVTKIQCNSCDKQWDSRGEHGSDGCKTVVLDAKIMVGYSYFNEKDIWGDYTHSDKMKIVADDLADYCTDCWEALFDESMAVEVEEPEYYVEEKSTDIYYCDFCESEMGDEPTHEVTVNPYIERETQKRGMGSSYFDTETVVVTRELDDLAMSRSGSKLCAKRHNSFDCCSQCVRDIFDISIAQTDSNKEKGLCATIKDILLF
jgi:hypothetical protein